MGNQKVYRRYCLYISPVPEPPEGNFTFQQWYCCEPIVLLGVRLMFRGVWWLERSSSQVSSARGVCGLAVHIFVGPSFRLVIRNTM